MRCLQGMAYDHGPFNPSQILPILVRPPSLRQVYNRFCLVMSAAAPSMLLILVFGCRIANYHKCNNLK